MFGKRVGRFILRGEEFLSGNLNLAPKLLPIFEELVAEPLHASRGLRSDQYRGNGPIPGITTQAA